MPKPKLKAWKRKVMQGNSWTVISKAEAHIGEHLPNCTVPIDGQWKNAPVLKGLTRIPKVVVRDIASFLDGRNTVNVDEVEKDLYGFQSRGKDTNDVKCNTAEIPVEVSAKEAVDDNFGGSSEGDVSEPKPSTDHRAPTDSQDNDLSGQNKNKNIDSSDRTGTGQFISFPVVESSNIDTHSLNDDIREEQSDLKSVLTICGPSASSRFQRTVPTSVPIKCIRRRKRRRSGIKRKSPSTMNLVPKSLDRNLSKELISKTMEEPELNANQLEVMSACARSDPGETVDLVHGTGTEPKSCHGSASLEPLRNPEISFRVHPESSLKHRRVRKLKRSSKDLSSSHPGVNENIEGYDDSVVGELASQGEGGIRLKTTPENLGSPKCENLNETKGTLNDDDGDNRLDVGTQEFSRSTKCGSENVSIETRVPVCEGQNQGKESVNRSPQDTQETKDNQNTATMLVSLFGVVPARPKRQICKPRLLEAFVTPTIRATKVVKKTLKLFPAAPPPEPEPGPAPADSTSAIAASYSPVLPSLASQKKKLAQTMKARKKNTKKAICTSRATKSRKKSVQQVPADDAPQVIQQYHTSAMFCATEKLHTGMFYLVAQEGNRMQLMRYNGYTVEPFDMGWMNVVRINAAAAEAMKEEQKSGSRSAAPEFDACTGDSAVPTM